MANYHHHSAFSLHCLICFDEFDSKAKFPVVLPCGHTYICGECANRLDRCMECRVSLFVEVSVHDDDVDASVVPPPPSTPSPMRLSAASRYHHQQVHNQDNRRPPPKKKKRRLPIPKNAVLLSLIETSEFAAEAAKKAATERRNRKHALPNGDYRSPGNNGEGDDGCFGEHSSVVGGTTASSSCSSDYSRAAAPEFSMLTSSFDDEDEEPDEEREEEHKIRIGTHVTAGACGTYAVSSKTGLVVRRSIPKSSSDPDVDRVTREHFERKLKRGELHELRKDRHLASSVTWVEKMSGFADMDTSNHEVWSVEARLVCLESDVSPRSDNVAATADASSSGEGDKDKSGEGGAGDRDTEEIQLNFGDRVQVVSLEGKSNGWVKLARGYGYIRAEEAEKHLVKVGLSKDKACRLEAVLQNLYLERTRLRRERRRIEREERNLEDLSSGMLLDLENMLAKSESDGGDDGVVAPAPEGMPRSESEVDLLLPQKYGGGSGSRNKNDIFSTPPRRLERGNRTSNDVKEHFPSSAQDSGDGDEAHAAEISANESCGDVVDAEFDATIPTVQSAELDPTAGVLVAPQSRPSYIVPTTGSPRRSSVGGVAPSSPSPARLSVNFKTGMSCHGGAYRTPSKAQQPASLPDAPEQYHHQYRRPPRERGRCLSTSLCAGPASPQASQSNNTAGTSVSTKMSAIAMSMACVIGDATEFLDNDADHLESPRFPSPKQTQMSRQTRVTEHGGNLRSSCRF